MLKAGFVLTIGLILGRVSGLVRELVLAQSVGVSEFADITILLLTFPDVIVTLLAAAAFGTAFIPHIHSLSLSARLSYFIRSSAVVFLAFLLLAVVTAIAASFFVQTLAPGLSPAGMAQATDILRWTTLAIPLFAMAALTRSFLHAEKRYNLVAFEVLFYNLILILGIVFWLNDFGLESIVLIVLIAGAIRWLPQLLLVWRSYPKAEKIQKLGSQSAVWRRYLNGLGAIFFISLLSWAARAFMSWQEGVGGVALFNYTNRLMELPLALGFAVLTPILFPKFSELFQSDQIDNHQQSLEIAMASYKFVIALSAAMLVPLIWLLLGMDQYDLSFGEMRPQDIHKIASLTLLGLISVPAKGLQQVNHSILNARLDTRAPFIIGTATFFLALPVFWLSGQWAQGQGIILALSLLFWLHALWGLHWVATKHWMPVIPIVFGSFAVKTLVISLLPIVPMLILEQLVLLNLASRFGLALFAGLLAVLMNLYMHSEFHEIKDQLFKRFKK